jgi:hypothetical protein
LLLSFPLFALSLLFNAPFLELLLLQFPLASLLQCRLLFAKRRTREANNGSKGIQGKAAERERVCVL